MTYRQIGTAVLPVAAFAFLWGDLIRRLGMSWSTNPQYAYGWAVPALSLFLGWKCWITRPAPQPAPAAHRAFALGAVLAFALLPTRLLLEAIPDWHGFECILAVEVIGLSLCAIYLMAGRAWLNHFAFPVAFVLTAVPWPVRFEQPFIGMLSEAVAILTVNALNLCQIPALKQGSLIEISTGIVGVEEACSGVRSFHATLMASLFIGQLWGFRWRPRVMLVGFGLLLAFACNVARAWFLTVVAEKKGISAIEKWHDPAGFTILLVTFSGLLGIALFLGRKEGPEVPADGVPPPRPLPVRFAGALAAWVVFTAVGTELWYRSGSAPSSAWWRVEFPTERRGFTSIPRARGLECDQDQSARWKEDDGSEWTMFWFRYLPGSASSRLSARGHRPEVCLQNAGFVLVSESAPERIRVPAADLAFRTYHFEGNGKPLYVFFCVWEDRKQTLGDPNLPPSPFNPIDRLEAVLRRDRNLGQQVLEVAIAGLATEAEARVRFRENIAPLLRPDTLDSGMAGRASGAPAVRADP